MNFKMAKKLSSKEILKLSNEESHKLTKECLQTALISLMTVKPFEKISITELVNKSGVSRTAFYRNYSKKEDIILEILDSFLKGLAISLTTKKTKNNDFYEFYLELFSKIKNNSDEFSLLLRAGMSNKQYFKLDHLLEKIILPDTAQKKYKLLAIESATLSIVIDWFSKEMNESPEFMANLCNNMVKAIF
jgi:AcrR family transcriptional regulator